MVRWASLVWCGSLGDNTPSMSTAAKLVLVETHWPHPVGAIGQRSVDVWLLVFKTTSCGIRWKSVVGGCCLKISKRIDGRFSLSSRYAFIRVYIMKFSTLVVCYHRTRTGQLFFFLSSEPTHLLATIALMMQSIMTWVNSSFGLFFWTTRVHAGVIFHAESFNTSRT